MTVASLEAIRCPLCSFEFAPVAACHAGCPLASHCHLLCCPNCGYQMVDAAQSRLLNGWRRLQARLGLGSHARVKHAQAQARAQEQTGVLKLSEAPLGVDLVVTAVEGLPPQVQARFTVLGLLPGAVVQVAQRRPAPVIRVGETELAVGLDLLACVQVTRA